MSTRAADLIPDALRFRPGQISMLLTVVALALWAFSLTQAKLVLDDWGIIHSLPISYFIAMALLTMASGILWQIKERHDFLLGLQLIFFIAMLWLTPLLLGTTLVATRYEFGYHSITQYIINYGHLDPTTQWLHNWPGLNLFETALVEITGIKNTDTMLIWAPLLIQFIIALPLYLFFRNLIGKSNHCWATVWLFYLFDHVAQFFLGNQSMALFLLFTLLSLLVKVFKNMKTRLPVNQLIVILLLFACLAVTHLLTSIVFLFILTVLCVVKRYNLILMVMLFTGILAVWTIFVTTNYFVSYAPTVIKNIFRIDLLFQVNVYRLAARGSEIHQIVATIRVLCTAIMAIIGSIGFVFSRKFKSDSDTLVVIIAIAILLILPFGFYEGEMVSRTFLFLLPVLAYFGGRMLRDQISAIILIILMIVTIPFSIISVHGNQVVDDISPSQRAYWRFIGDSTVGGHFTGGGMVWGWSLNYAGKHNYDPGICVPSIEDGYQWQENLFTGKWSSEVENSYIGLSSYELELYKVGYGDNQFVSKIRSWLNNSTNYKLIFTSGDVTSYMYEGLK